MSYILDALKKSDQERQQRATPALNSIYSTEAPRPAGRRKPWPILLLLALLLNAGLLLWWLQPWQGTKPEAQPLEPQAMDPVPPVARKAAEDVQAAAPQKKEPPARKAPAAKTLPENPKSAPEPAPSPPQPNHREAEPPAPAATVAAAAPQPDAVRTAQPRSPSDSRPRAANEPQASAPAADAAGVDKGPAKPDAKKAVDLAAADTKQPSFGKNASQEARKDSTSPREARPTSTARAAKAAAKAEAVKPAPEAASARHADKAQSALEALVGKQVPFAGEESPQAEQPAPAPAPQTPAPRASAPRNDVPEYEELPLKTRDELPNLSFSMFVYSKDPANRLVGFRGRVVREGQELSPGLKVENIGPNGAVLNYNGKRFFKKQF